MAEMYRMSSAALANVKKLFTPEKIRHISAVFGGILVHLSLGTLYTFGNINPYVTSFIRMRSTPDTLRYSDTVWVFALSNVGFGVAMFLGGILQRNVGPRWTTAIGSLIMSLGVAVSYYAVQASFYWFIVSYGLMLGLGMGIAYATPMQVSVQWMPKRKGLAAGLIVAGFGGGAFVFNQVQTAYLNPDNLPAVNSTYLNTTQTLPDSEKYFNEDAILDRVPSMFLLLGGIYAFMQVIGSLLLFSPAPSQAAEEMHSLMAAASGSEASDDEYAAKSAKKHGEAGSVPPCEAIRTRTFITLWFMFLCNQQVTMFISTLYKSFGLGFIADDRALTWLGAFAAIFNATGRIFWGLLADRFSFKAAMLTLCGSMTILMLTLYFTQYIAKEMFYVWVCLIFLCFSGNFSLFPSAIAHNFGTEHMAVTYGLLFTCTLVAGVVGALLSDHLTRLIGLLGVFSLGSGLSAAAFMLLLTLGWSPSCCTTACRLRRFKE